MAAEARVNLPAQMRAARNELIAELTTTVLPYVLSKNEAASEDRVQPCRGHLKLDLTAQSCSEAVVWRRYVYRPLTSLGTMFDFARALVS